MKRMKRIILQLGRMRKPTDFSVYPQKDGEDHVIIQGGAYIGQVHVGDNTQKATGNGVMSGPHYTGAYFMHLNPVLGKHWNFTLTAEQLEELIAITPQSGDEIGQGVYID